MKPLFSGIAICMLAGLFSAGCTSCSEASKPEELQSYGDDPTGTGGTNGLTPPIFHKWAAKLNQLMSESALTTSAVAEPPLGTVPGTAIKVPHIFQLNQAYTSFYQQLTAAGGRKLLDYAIGCAFGRGYGVQYPDQQMASGNGLLQRVQSWAIGPLDLYQRNAVFTCLVTRMNAAGEEVPIRLLGRDVPNTPLKKGEVYPFEEAVWVARWEPIKNNTNYSSALFLDVWPSQTLLTEIKVNLNNKIQSRVCDQTQAVCGLTIHSSADAQGSGCESKNNHWICFGHAAIETRLSEPGWNVIYQTFP